MLKHLQGLLAACLASIAAIEAKGDQITQDDVNEYKRLTDEGNELRKQIETAQSAEGLKAWGDTPAPGPEHRGLPTFEEPAGTELVSGKPGERRSLDATGWNISAKQFQAISEPSYKGAFLRFLRGKNDTADMKALEEGIDSSGGYLVPPDLLGRVISRKPHPTSVLGLIDRFNTSRDRVQIPKFKYSTDDIYATGLRIAWTGETGSSAEDTSLENWGMVEIPIYTGSFEVHAYRDMLEDAAYDVEGFIVKQIQSCYDLGMDNVVVLGTGIGQPEGICPNAGAADRPPTANVGNPATADGWISFINGHPPQYSDNAQFLCNKTNVWNAITQLKDSASNYIGGLAHNIDGGLASARSQAMLGNPVAFSAFMANGGAAAKIAVFGDFREGYSLVERVGLAIEPLTDANLQRANKRGWHVRFRAGGRPTQDRALRVAVQS